MFAEVGDCSAEPAMATGQGFNALAGAKKSRASKHVYCCAVFFFSLMIVLLVALLALAGGSISSGRRSRLRAYM